MGERFSKHKWGIRQNLMSLVWVEKSKMERNHKKLIKFLFESKLICLWDKISFFFERLWDKISVLAALFFVKKNLGGFCIKEQQYHNLLWLIKLQFVLLFLKNISLKNSLECQIVRWDPF